MKKPNKTAPPEDLTGRRFERWTVKSYAGFRKRHFWNVVCDCGRVGEVGTYQLKTGKSKSCGCYAHDVNRQNNLLHGESAGGRRSPELRAYNLALNQCRSPAHQNYDRFGGAGVEFRFNCFEDFLLAVGRRPEGKFVLTRIDRTGHYERGNVRWTTNKNRRKKVE